ncbi:adipokinetic hormone/corazonin-related peptide receptor variant I-like [Cydia splendana]|uniref:adipokinetic hormone/corazonin-related peptide receptor variant I-like n=1 Tax=Cydia splendana TaxID=1100963 RepID=UPI00300C1481
MSNVTKIDNSTKDSSIDKQFWDYFESESPYNTSLAVQTDGACVVTVYFVLLFGGAAGNLAVLTTLARSRRRSRVSLLMTHLAVADVCVVCGVIPLEIGWKYTNAWLAGNFCCKLLLVLRAFGLYLSSNVLVCISVDRFFAVLYPLRLPAARRRSKQMLYCAWAMALACSLPQSVVFSVKQHPVVPGFSQCVSFEAFSSPYQEVAYNVFCLCAMYFLPLAVITACYVRIFAEIHHSSKEIEDSRRAGGPVRLRRSDRRVLQRARRRTLRMTVTIVSVFALCWLPYATMCMWWMVDRDSARQIPSRVQGLLFAMAVSNSCMNPLVYGSYRVNFRSMARRFCKGCCIATSASDTIERATNARAFRRNSVVCSVTAARAGLTPAAAPHVRGARAKPGAVAV